MNIFYTFQILLTIILKFKNHTLLFNYPMYIVYKYVLDIWKKNKLKLCIFNLL